MERYVRDNARPRAVPPRDAAAEALRYMQQHVLSFGADVVETEEGSFLKYRRGSGRHAPVFCVLRPLSSRVDVAFRRWSRARSKRVLDARTAGIPHLPYRVIVEAPGDIDSELLAWVRESYEISGEA